MNHRKRQNQYSVLLSEGEDGYWVVQCLEIPAAMSQGRTQREALENIKDAIQLVLEHQRDAVLGQQHQAARRQKILVPA